MKVFTAALASLSLLIAPVAYAQQETPQDSAPSSSPAQQPQNKNSSAEQQIPLTQSKPAQQKPLISTKALEGKTVKNQQGKDIGKIQELMVDPDSGRVQYVVLASGSMWSKGGDTLSIPWETLRLGWNKEDLVVELDKDQLQKVPSEESATASSH